MKIDSKFQLGLTLAWQGCVAPSQDILLGLSILFSVWIIQRLNYLAVIFVVMILVVNHNTLACHVV
jgi:hypothetical protein